MADPDLSSFKPLLEDALRAYRTDSAYALDMAKQARILLSRQGIRTEKEAIPA